MYIKKLKWKWQLYLRCMEIVLRAIAKELDISLQTSLDWRHKILCSFAKIVPNKLSSEIGSDKLKLNNTGCKKIQRKPRKRGGGTTLSGILVVKSLQLYR